MASSLFSHLLFALIEPFAKHYDFVEVARSILIVKQFISCVRGIVKKTI